MKRCAKCGIEKDLSDFHKSKPNKDGRHYTCKECFSKYYLENKERIDKRTSDYAKKHKKEGVQRCLKWKRKNKGICNRIQAKRRASKTHATPKWLTEFDLDYIKSIYNQASYLGLHVDHIVPLQGKNVSGLHVPWNLQLLTKSENSRKGNRYDYQAYS